VYDGDLAAGRAESAVLQLLLSAEVTCDNAARFAATLGARDPKLIINGIFCREFSVWELLDWDDLALAKFCFAMGVRKITRLLLGCFEVISVVNSLACTLAPGDEELIRDVCDRTPDEMRTQCIRSSLGIASALQLEISCRWLLGPAHDASLDRGRATDGRGPVGCRLL
jgi:hypothetical protein